MKTLTYVSTKEVNALTWPVTIENTTLYSPALCVFTDFKTSAPRVIESNTRADELVRLMRKEHVRMKVVVDEKNNFVGVISLEDLSEDAFIKHVANGYARSELLVADLMKPKDKVLALSYASLKNSDIESLLYSQRETEGQHLLVIDEETKTIRGLVSASDIARQLRLDIDVAFSSFKNIYKIALLGEKYNSKKLRVA
ncbi:CBS domain-containing protein [Marinomonas spartinae]|uniref:CBS domain-containing protein n=1 Tax=Marinomonas spartinae TaxID=1792290 RepID=UPI0018F2092A|nr:CBS domain-containing protein [Marinomonas spartinae]MBJ7554006.1 CBS domain-containing protein [Marinomonas spartinae]